MTKVVPKCISKSGSKRGDKNRVILDVEAPFLELKLLKL